MTIHIDEARRRRRRGKMGEKTELWQQSIREEKVSNLKKEKEARRGSFNAFFWVRVWVLGEALCFMSEGEMRTKGNVISGGRLTKATDW